jgi:hypothetical protein
MIRYFIMLSGMLATLSASAAEGSYFRVLLYGGDDTYEYRFSPHASAPSLESHCSDDLPSACKRITDPAYQVAPSDHEPMTTAVIRAFHKESVSARAAADSQLRRAVVFNRMASREPFKFEVHNLETGAVEMSAMAKRRISAAEMLGTHGCVVLLTSSYRVDWMPWNWPLTLAGHPPQYDSYYLEFYGADGKMFKELLIKKDLKYAGGYMLSHVEEEPDAPFGPNGSC